MSLAVYRTLILDRLREQIPLVLERYRTFHDVTEDDAPDPAVYHPGPPPLTAAEGYPAVYVTPLELLSLSRSERPTEYTARYRFEAVAYVKGDTAPHAQTQLAALAYVLRAALIGRPRLSDRVVLSPTTLTERYSAIDPVAGGTLAGIAAVFELTAEETSFPDPPRGTVAAVGLTIEKVPVPDPID